MSEIISNSFDLLQDSINSRKWLAKNISKDTELISICSAYLKEDALDFLLSTFIDNAYEGPIRILSRWKPNDLLSGSSDLSAYELASKYKIPFYIKQNFHGKVYEIKPLGLLVGSANLTNSGFQLKGSGNDEVCVALKNTIENTLFVDNLFNTSILITDILFSKIFDDLSNMTPIEVPDYKWSNLLINDITYGNSDKFLIDDMLHSNGHGFLLGIENSDIDILHDLSLLGCNNSSTNIEIETAFLNSVSYKWLQETLSKNNNEMRYGSLTSVLHSSLLDEARPYRQDVKKLLSNLLSWCEVYAINKIQIARPRHSQMIKLIRN
jgi:hypothetical protein